MSGVEGFVKDFGDRTGLSLSPEFIERAVDGADTLPAETQTLAATFLELFGDRSFVAQLSAAAAHTEMEEYLVDDIMRANIASLSRVSDRALRLLPADATDEQRVEMEELASRYPLLRDVTKEDVPIEAVVFVEKDVLQSLSGVMRHLRPFAEAAFDFTNTSPALKPFDVYKKEVENIYKHYSEAYMELSRAIVVVARFARDGRFAEVLDDVDEKLSDKDKLFLISNALFAKFSGADGDTDTERGLFFKFFNLFLPTVILLALIDTMERAKQITLFVSSSFSVVSVLSTTLLNTPYINDLFIPLIGSVGGAFERGDEVPVFFDLITGYVEARRVGTITLYTLQKGFLFQAPAVFFSNVDIIRDLLLAYGLKLTEALIAIVALSAAIATRKAMQKTAVGALEFVGGVGTSALKRLTGKLQNVVASDDEDEAPAPPRRSPPRSRGVSPGRRQRALDRARRMKELYAENADV